ncbi:MAG: pilus assembly protein TadG-related protein [Deltaproteobacteria bacterium]|nr:pilus assembly protein TadG-related protein [Deltaproteobacteria bacterium]
MRLPYALMKDESGSLAAFSIFLLVVFMALLAFTVDLGHLYVVKGELQNAADAGALAGARAIYLNTISPNPDWSAGQTATTNAIRDNKADNSDLLGGQVETGYWDKTWTPSTAPAHLKSTGISQGPNEP